MPNTFSPDNHFAEIVLVGLGGTGSQWARTLCRIVWDLRRRRQHIPQIRFVDPDRIEAKNVGRQMFTQADVGAYKAEVLAHRFNLALGLGVTWHNEPFQADKHARSYGTLLCGAVDNHVASHSFCTNPRAGKLLFSEFLRRYSHNYCTNPAKVSEFLRERSTHERRRYPHL